MHAAQHLSRIARARYGLRVLHLAIRTCPRKPHGASARGLPILNGMGHYVEADGAEQLCVLIGIQTGMIQRITPIRPDRLARTGSGVEHQDC